MAARTLYWNPAANANFNGATSWALSPTGTPDEAAPTAEDTCYFSDSNSKQCTINASSVCLNFDCSSGSGFAGTITGTNSMTVSGYIRLKSGMTNNYTGTITMNSTTGTVTVRSDTVAWGSSITFNGVGGTFQLYDNFTTATGKTLTLSNGTLDINGKALSVGILTLGTGTKTLADIATGGSITVTGNNATIINKADTGLTLTTIPTVVCNYSGSTGTRTIAGGTGGTAALAMNINITGGTDTVTFTTNGNFGAINLTGFGGTISDSNRLIWGNLTIPSGVTFTGGTGYWMAKANLTITSLSTMDLPITVNNTGITVTLGSDITLGSTRALTLTDGSLTCVNGGNNYALSVGSVASGAGTVTLTLGSATHSLTGTGTVWDFSKTLSASTGTIKITDTSNTDITFAGRSKTFNNIWFSRGSSTATNTISGSNVFSDFKDDGTAAHTIAFTAASTQHVTTFTVNGNSGQLITLNSTTTGTYTLTKDGGGTISCSYLDIYHSVATPANTWYANDGTSVNHQAVATAGSGWTFPVGSTGNMLPFFY